MTAPGGEQRRAGLARKAGRGFVAGALSMLIVVIGGPLWHNHLGHSSGFGFLSFNALGWILLIAVAMILGGLHGLLVAAVDLLRRSWLTIPFGAVLWSWRAVRNIVSDGGLPPTALDLGYLMLAIVAGTICAVAIAWPRLRGREA